MLMRVIELRGRCLLRVALCAAVRWLWLAVLLMHMRLDLCFGRVGWVKKEFKKKKT